MRWFRILTVGTVGADGAGCIEFARIEGLVLVGVCGSATFNFR